MGFTAINNGDNKQVETLEHWAGTFARGAASCAELVVAFIIAVAIVRALGAYLLSWLRPTGNRSQLDDIRLTLGRSLALALEFALGADILKTAVAPTWNEIGQLAAIATLRTALNYFLERELESAAKRIPGIELASHTE